MPYAIRRIFDGKLLPLPHHRTRLGITWCEFDDDQFTKKPSIPALWPSKAGAVSTMKLWRRGGWRTTSRYGGKMSVAHQPERDKFPVEVVEVQVVPVVEPIEEQQLPREAQNPLSTL